MRGALAGLLALGAALAGTSLAGAQELKRAVESLPDGRATFQYEVREGVWICDEGIRVGRSWYHGGWSAGRDEDCVEGVAEVRLTVEGGRIRSLRLGPPHSGSSALELGRQTPDDAVDYLLWLATTARSSVAEDAIFPATLSDGVIIWPRLLEIARDRARPEGVRKQAVFWLGQAAGTAATTGLGEIATDDTEEDEIRDAAVFALSQRPAEESVPLLMDLAETAEYAKVRRSALFWLAQSNAPGVVDFFEKILRGG
jgi:HEAT repeats